jgi:hypothetical protein
LPGVPHHADVDALHAVEQPEDGHFLLAGAEENESQGARRSARPLDAGRGLAQRSGDDPTEIVAEDRARQHAEQRKSARERPRFGRTVLGHAEDRHVRRDLARAEAEVTGALGVPIQTDDQERVSGIGLDDQDPLRRGRRKPVEILGRDDLGNVHGHVPRRLRIGRGFRSLASGPAGTTVAAASRIVGTLSAQRTFGPGRSGRRRPRRFEQRAPRPLVQHHQDLRDLAFAVREGSNLGPEGDLGTRRQLDGNRRRHPVRRAPRLVEKLGQAAAPQLGQQREDVPVRGLVGADRATERAVEPAVHPTHLVGRVEDANARRQQLENLLRPARDRERPRRPVTRRFLPRFDRRSRGRLVASNAEQDPPEARVFGIPGGGSNGPRLRRIVAAGNHERVGHEPGVRIEDPSERLSELDAVTRGNGRTEQRLVVEPGTLRVFYRTEPQ